MASLKRTLIDFTLNKRLPKITNALGVNSDMVPPDPIPNSAVKHVCGENIAGEALCEDSTMPIYKAPKEKSLGALPFF